MSRDAMPLYIDDLSSFAKALRQNLSEKESLPGHSAFLTQIAKAAGARNYQHLRAIAPQSDTSEDVVRAMRYFDDYGQMSQWPAQTKIQGLCLWPFWARIKPRFELTEQEINTILKQGCGFGDHVLMRRSLIDHKLMKRQNDGSKYIRIEQIPSADALAMIRGLPNIPVHRKPVGHQVIE
ncbi:MAG: DUF2087 domain-containing protein [Pseudoruegeria sp.]